MVLSGPKCPDCSGSNIQTQAQVGLQTPFPNSHTLVCPDPVPEPSTLTPLPTHTHLAPQSQDPASSIHPSHLAPRSTIYSGGIRSHLPRVRRSRTPPPSPRLPRLGHHPCSGVSGEHLPRPGPPPRASIPAPHPRPRNGLRRSLTFSALRICSCPGRSV